MFLKLISTALIPGNNNFASASCSSFPYTHFRSEPEARFCTDSCFLQKNLMIFTHSLQKAEIMEGRHSKPLMQPLLLFLASNHDQLVPHLQSPVREGGCGAYLVPKGEVSHGVLSCQGDAAEQDEKQDQVGENVIVNDAMAVHTKPAREGRGTTLALKEQQDLETFPPSSSASWTGGLPCRASSLCPSTGTRCAGQCWLSTGLTLLVFEWRAITPS